MATRNNNFAKFNNINVINNINMNFDYIAIIANNRTAVYLSFNETITRFIKGPNGLYKLGCQINRQHPFKVFLPYREMQLFFSELLGENIIFINPNLHPFVQEWIMAWVNNPYNNRFLKNQLKYSAEDAEYYEEQKRCSSYSWRNERQ